MIPRLSIALVSLLCLAATPAAAGVAKHCTTGCVYKLKAGPTARDWRAPWAATKDDVLAVTVTIGGERLSPEIVGDYEMRYYGHGTVVKVTTSATATAPARLRLVTVNDRHVNVRVELQTFARG